MTRVASIAKVVLLNERGEVLMLRRSKTAPTRALEQDFPGGYVEEDEDVRAAVVREVKEETSLDIDYDQLRLVYTTTMFRKGESGMCFLHTIKLKETPEIALSYEHDQYKWLPPSDVLKDFDHPVWSDGFAYALEYQLLPS